MAIRDVSLISVAACGSHVLEYAATAQTSVSLLLSPKSLKFFFLPLTKNLSSSLYFFFLGGHHHHASNTSTHAGQSLPSVVMETIFFQIIIGRGAICLWAGGQR